MPTSTSNIFCRVNRRRPCRICGKPDWCVFVRDETLSVCMRVSDGARKINRHGGAIFFHDGWREDKPAGVRVVADLPQSPIAPVEIRDFVYGKLIEISPATLYPGALIANEKGLLARGLSERHFGDYGGLPAGSSERDRIARLLLREASDQFSGSDLLRGVPGFWEDRRGAHLWKPKDYLLPRLLIPVRDGSGRIRACQMRMPFAAKKGLRYLWLSSSDLPHGTGSGSPLHFKFRFADLPRDAWIVIVEGVLKADVLSALRPELYIVATPCVTANHDALVELTRGRFVWIGFDQDHYSNETVCFHLASLVARRLRREMTLATTRIASWDASVKGIDDAAVRNLPITSISIQHWLDRLSPRFRQIAMMRLSEIAEVPLRTKNK
ncbi:MAG: hypothetical protein L0226_14040 [Acidobacteria bacterium]|nr:hypothetical protein [Acidobacteriota bacterium]